MSRSRGSTLASSSTSAVVPSVQPLATTTTSHSTCGSTFWPSKERSSFRMFLSSLCAVTHTLTRKPVREVMSRRSVYHGGMDRRPNRYSYLRARPDFSDHWLGLACDGRGRAQMWIGMRVPAARNVPTSLYLSRLTTSSMVR